MEKKHGCNKRNVKWNNRKKIVEQIQEDNIQGNVEKDVSFFQMGI